MFYVKSVMIEEDSKAGNNTAKEVSFRISLQKRVHLERVKESCLV